MNITVGAKIWTSGNQIGLRLYEADMIALANQIQFPDRDQIYPNLHAFIQAVQANAGAQPRPQRYSRLLWIAHPGDPIIADRFCTFADNTGSLQGYVTALPGTWFHNYVAQRMDTDFQVNYITFPGHDMILLP